MTPNLDITLQTVCPTVMVPRFAALEPLERDGHRFLVASDGLHLEVRRPWLHAMLPVGDSAIPLPYGEVTPVVRFRLDGLTDRLTEFCAAAARVFPNEHAAWFSIGKDDRRLYYEEAEVIDTGPAHINYQRPRVADNRVLAVDCHSHGSYAAGFSRDDDADSLDDAKLEIVVGNLGSADWTLACRLSVLGVKIDYSQWLRNVVSTTFSTTRAFT